MGKEPALLIGFVGAVLTALSGHVSFVHAGIPPLVVAVLTALLVAWRTEPKTPALFVGVLTATVALFGAYGFHMSDVTVAGLTGVLLAGLALVGVRAQASPVVAAPSRADRE